MDNGPKVKFSKHLPVSHLLASIMPNRHIEMTAGITGRIVSNDDDCHSGSKMQWH